MLTLFWVIVNFDFATKIERRLWSNMANSCTKVALTRIRSNTHIVTFKVKNSTTVTQSQHIWYLCQLVRSQFNFINYYLWRETNRGAQRLFPPKLIFMKGLFRLSSIFRPLEMHSKRRYKICEICSVILGELISLFEITGASVLSSWNFRWNLAQYAKNWFLSPSHFWIRKF